jgi:hypothetical protein
MEERAAKRVGKREWGIIAVSHEVIGVIKI